MMKVTASIKAANVKVGDRNWETITDKPTAGERVCVELKASVGQKPLFISLFMRPSEFNEMQLTKLSSRIKLLLDESEFEDKGRFFVVRLPLGESQVLIERCEVNPDFKEFDFTFGNVDYHKSANTQISVDDI